ncbi:MAG: hypothetical protein IJT51_07925 [Bacteroidales bacterium]|nr:hypothetical protein [Bacteroidales bacterium]
MKKIILSICMTLALSFNMLAQSETEIPLCVVVPQKSEIPNDALQFLENQLEHIATQNGTNDFLVCDRFILTAKVDVVQKDIVAGPPQRISQTLNITLQVGDAVDNKLYASASLMVMGIGANLTKAYMEAFKQIQKNNQQIIEFLAQAKEKIVAYYAQHCESIYTEAQSLAKRQQYDDALYRLACIPDIGIDCYTRCQNAMSEIWLNKTNAEGRQLLKQAQASWATAHDETGAQTAARFLQQINPAADCHREVAKLIDDITSKMKQNEEKQWQFQLKQYEDRVRQEQSRMQNEQELNKMAIRAAREVAVAFAQNQPQREYVIW